MSQAYPNQDPESPSGQPLGRTIDWTPVERPAPLELRGRHATLRPLSVDVDVDALFAVSRDPAIWTYLPDGPYETVDALRDALQSAAASDEKVYFTICRDGVPEGIASYLRINPGDGTIEIGHIWFGTPLQRTTASTEAIFLLAKHAFDELGYRRLEWKCNALNAKSRRAAERFGFTFEGVFRNHMVVKGRNRDTAWFAITREDWPPIRQGFERWLDPENFDETGRQRARLSELIR